MWHEQVFEFPPSDTTHRPTVRAEIGFSVHRLRFRVVCQPQAELAVDLGLVGGVRVGEHWDDVPEGPDQRGDFGA